MRAPALLVAIAAVLAGCAAPPAEPETASPTARALVCDAPCAVTIATGRLWEPMVAVDPTDPLHLVATSHEKYGDPVTGRSSWAHAHVSRDGGASWSTHRLPGGRDAGVDHPMGTVTWLDDAVPFFFPDGTLVITVLGLESLGPPGAVAYVGPHLFALRSSDGGETFPDVVAVARATGPEAAALNPVGSRPFGTGSSDSHDKQWVAVGKDGTAFMAWSHNHHTRADACGVALGCTDVVFSTSRDGVAWTEPQRIVRDTYSGAFPLALDDGATLLTYHDGRVDEMHLARSTDGGASWDFDALGPSTKFPVLARSSDATRERVHLAYPLGQDDRDGEQTIALRWSDDAGLTWTDALTLHAPEAPGRTIPALAPAPDLAAFVAYWSPRAEDADYHVVHVDARGNVTGPLVLSTHEGPTHVTGDYMGIAALPDGSAYVVWTTSDGDALRLAGARVRLG